MRQHHPGTGTTGLPRVGGWWSGARRIELGHEALVTSTVTGVDLWAGRSTCHEWLSWGPVEGPSG